MDVNLSPNVALAQSIPALAATDLVAPALAPVNDLAAARFAAIMAQPLAGTEAASAAAAAAATGLEPAAVTTVTAVSSGSGSGAMGERILAGMQSASGDMQAAWSDIAGVLDGGAANVNMQEMLKLQMNLMQVTMQYELVGKAVSRAGQNIDHLVRLQ